jgi:hypothetical protein
MLKRNISSFSPFLPKLGRFLNPKDSVTAQIMPEADLFLEAREEFLRSISETERSTFSNCSSTAELLTDVRNITATIEKKNRRTQKVIHSIQRFSHNLEPYFDVVGIVISSHPDVAAIAWGAFRLILQV